MMEKSQINIPWAKPALWGNEKKYVADALDSLWISGGKYIEQLEDGFSGLFNKKYALAVCNGTAAIHLPYLSLGLRQGDEVIVPGFSFMAAANLALQMHLKPIFAEVDPKTWCLTAGTIENLITPNTKAVVPVHTYGNVCDMDDLVALAKAKNINIIEDCAEALFSKYNGHYCGTSGTVGCFSFQATKTLTTGEGGLVVTDDEELYRRMILYRSHGLGVRGTYGHILPGHNFRITNMQAAMGCAQFEKLEKITGERKRIHQSYRRVLERQQGFVLQHFPPSVDPVLWAFALKLDPKAFPQGRNAVIQQLKDKGIETRPGFTASSLLNIYKPHSLPVCEDLSRQVMSLPTYATLGEEEISFVCKVLLGVKR